MKPTDAELSTARLILDIIFEYALNKFDDSRDRLEGGAENFLAVIAHFVSAETRVEACLPAFPFKSANKVYKVLGHLPDKAEELALERLDTMCWRIQEVYQPGAQVTIISDGITYNDLLCISDQDTWAYGEALRKMALQKGFDNIAFARIKDLVDFPAPHELREITYVANCTTFRRLLLNKYGQDDLDIDHEIATNPDTKLTFLGYKRFLESDLKYIFPQGQDRSGNSYKRDCKYLAKQMLVRGHAFARAVKSAFPNHLRLSIHESVGGTKVSMRLLNTRSGFTTPWHCSVAQLANGEWISAPMGELEKDDRLELVYEDGRPSYYKELSQARSDALGITQANATYLQPATPLSAQAYLSVVSTPRIVTPDLAKSHGGSSVSSIDAVGTDSTPTTPEVPSVDGSAQGDPENPLQVTQDKDKVGQDDTQYGRRLIPQIMDELAAAEPSRHVFSLATRSHGSLQFRHVTAQTFAKAVDKTAWWLQEALDDLRHVLLTYACVKVGYAALFLSPKNNTEGCLAVLEATNCNIWVSAADALPVPLVEEVFQQRSMQLLALPSLNDLLDNQDTKSFLYTKTFEDAINDPFLGVLPNINLVDDLAESAKIDIWSMVPSLVDEVGETPEILAKLKPSKFICASGGPVSPVSASKVNEVIRVLNLTGTTEGLFIGNLVPPREDWYWFCFHPYSGFEFKQVEEDTYEHWVHRNQHWQLFQGIYHTFPEKTSINFKDLYMRHPTKPNLWAFKGRSDDLVVLSNGYKISPLETEAFVTTHPAIHGCLIFGTGRPQAGLLIELKDPSQKSPEQIESIWATVQKANSVSRHRNQLLRDFVTFSEPDKPFIRTDKQTVKRSATLALYADYIERFYTSRNDDLDETYSVDLQSRESIMTCVRGILASSLPGIDSVSADTDLFDLGLDSLGVFAAVKSIRAATALGDTIAPRHVYAHPTIAGISDTVASMVVELEEATRASPAQFLHGDLLQDIITQHKARQSFRLNALDYVNPNHGMGLMFYLPLRPDTRYADVFDNLQRGLNRTFDMIPALGGKIMECSEQEFGYVKGDLCVSIPPLSMAKSVHNRLVYKDLTGVLPCFDELRRSGFAPSAFRDGLVLRDDPFPKMPADIFVGQVNFVSGGCILAVDLNHCCLDGLGAMVALKAWAENCRYLQGDTSAMCSWYDPESFNHSLPEILHKHEGWARPVEDIDPGTWGFLPFSPPGEDKTLSTALSKKDGVLPPRPKYPVHSVWPLPRAERCLKTTLFLITPEKVAQMKQDVLLDPEAKGVITSISDIVQAFFWRAAIRTRYRVAREIRRQEFGEDELSILELPTDGRPYFSPLLPSTYMGSLLIMSRTTMPIQTLCAPETSIGRVAYQLRQSAARITPSVVHDAVSILQSLPDHTRFSTANMGLEHMHAMISNMMLFPMGEICFGDAHFANGGEPESMRPQIDRGSGRFRFLVIFPMKLDGGVELVMGTHPEELKMLMEDEEFTKYAEFVDCE
ncbi:Transferase family protein [Emericellopsis cladophorae]|uniref:Transferase family protein n=1 Tax=Emericellopsis cladophorae TaxID=2686198 RepID=A0A9Q0BC13_9HYPO|nr:Transferase family protein [Emericellopsis cladophorae]KAI6779256.1 Transferase family protein [Emericellopsis cladophorae]